MLSPWMLLLRKLLSPTPYLSNWLAGTPLTMNQAISAGLVELCQFSANGPLLFAFTPEQGGQRCVVAREGHHPIHLLDGPITVEILNVLRKAN